MGKKINDKNKKPLTSNNVRVMSLNETSRNIRLIDTNVGPWNPAPKVTQFKVKNNFTKQERHNQYIAARPKELTSVEVEGLPNVSFGEIRRLVKELNISTSCVGDIHKYNEEFLTFLIEKDYKTEFIEKITSSKKYIIRRSNTRDEIIDQALSSKYLQHNLANNIENSNQTRCQVYTLRFAHSLGNDIYRDVYHFIKDNELKKKLIEIIRVEDLKKETENGRKVPNGTESQ